MKKRIPHRSITALAAVLLVLCWIGSTRAGDFYVDPVVGSDDLGDGSQQSPWLTIQHAFDSIEGTALEPHTIHLAEGEYGRDTNGEVGIPGGQSYRFIDSDSYESILGEDPHESEVDLPILAMDQMSIDGIAGSVLCGDHSPLIQRILACYQVMGVSAGDQTQPEIINCTFFNCECGFGYFDPNLATIRNCVFWSNEENFSYGEGTLDVNYSIVEGGYPGAGNIDADPRFIDPEDGDFRLQWDSPCIDAGDPTDPVPPGGGSRIDIGNWEYPFLPIPKITSMTFQDDLGGDGDGIPEAGETIRSILSLTNYGEPATHLTGTVSFDPGEITVSVGDPSFPDLGSGECGDSQGDLLVWTVPAGWPVAGSAELRLAWNSDQGSGMERFRVTLNGTDVWVDPATGDDDIGDGSAGNPWRTVGRACGQIRGTRFQPVTIHLREGTYSPATNGEPLPLRPGEYERLVGEWTVAQPVIDGAEGEEKLVVAGRGADLVDLELICRSDGVHDIDYNRAEATILGCLIRNPESDTALLCTKVLQVVDCQIEPPIAVFDSVVSGCEAASIRIEDGQILNCRFDLASSGSGVAFIDGAGLIQGCEFAAPSHTHDVITSGRDSRMVDNRIHGSGGVQSAGEFTGNLMDGGGEYPYYFASGDAVARGNTFLSAGRPVFIHESSATPFTNNLVLAEALGIKVYMASPRIENNTILGPSPWEAEGIRGWEGTPIRNCIVWTTGQDLLLCDPTYSCIEDGDPGIGNISAEPLLIGLGSSSELGTWYLADETASWVPGDLTGLRLNPNLAQGRTYLVEGNTVDTIFLYEDPTAVASAGDPYLVSYLRLQSRPEGWPADSPCIDAGDPDPAYDDPDGSRCDMGAWGGPFADPGPPTTPTITPSPAPSATATTTPEPTPTPSLGVVLDMPASYYRPGASCWLTARIFNPDGALPRAPLFVVLEWAGEYWFAPSWPAWPDEGLDGYWFDPLAPGSTEVGVIDPFLWPDGAGEGTLRFHAALTDETVSVVLGTPDSLEIGFGK